MTLSNHQALIIVNEIVGEIFSLADLELDSDSVASDVDGWDSLSHILIIHELEKRFEIRLPVEETYRVNNIGELCDLLVRLHDQKGSR